MTKPEVTRIKRKMLGVRIRSARNQAGLNLKETAQQMGVSPATLNDYELGQQEAGLPELEAMARIFAVPISYFWANGLLKTPDRKYKAAQAISIRRKMLGAQLRQARQEAGHNQEALAEVLGCPVERLADYELGKISIPFSELESMASFLNLPLTHFLLAETQLAEPEQAEAQPVEAQQQVPQPVAVEPQPAGAGDDQPEAALPADLAWLADLPEDVKKFLEDPSSLLYLKLSMRSHNLSAETLRALAEGILDITY
jgi:transcriptional regulator with XRE-family HTH domain